MDGPLIIKVVVKGNDLMLTDSKGKVSKYNRVKVDSSGKDAEDYIKAGRERSKIKDYQEAIRNFDKAIALNPNYVDSYLERGIAYYSLKNYKKALDDFNQAVELDPKNRRAFESRGMTYLYFLKSYQQAINDFTKAIEIDPQNAYYLYRHRAYSYRPATRKV